jgi:hypothetical protein
VVSKTERLQNIYTAGAIGLLFLVSVANSAWVPAAAIAALGLALFLFPNQRRAILVSATIAVVVAVGLAVGGAGRF